MFIILFLFFLFGLLDKMKKVLISIVFILTSNLVEAGIFLKEKDPLIVQGMLYYHVIEN